MPAAEIKLSTIGSRIAIAVAPAALAEADGGTQTALELHDGASDRHDDPRRGTLACPAALATREPVLPNDHSCDIAREAVTVDPAAVPHTLREKLAAIEALDREVERLQAEDRRRRDEECQEQLVGFGRALRHARGRVGLS